MITKRQMGLAAPTAARTGRLDQWYDALISAMTGHFITTPARIEYFLANIMEETGELQAKVENLNYGAGQLRALFDTIFDGQLNADQTVAGGQEAIGNAIYGDQYRTARYKLGNRDPGDGYKYRGRGPMQLTGRSNYEQFFKAAGLPIDSDPDLLLAPAMGAESAAHFWDVAGCNACADRGDFEAAVRKVNGGTINMATRQAYLARFVEAMNHPDPVAPQKPTRPPETPEITLPTPETASPVTEDDFKPKPKPKPVLEPVPPPPPVPPVGYAVQDSGNVIRVDVKQSEIVKGADLATKVAVAVPAVTAVSGTAASVAGMDWKTMAALGAVVLACVLGYAVYKLLQIKAARIEMNAKGIA